VKTQNDKISRFLALDFGAESGRGELITLSENKIQLEELHRFPNRPVNLCGTLVWDFPFLFAELLTTLQVCADKNLSLNGIGVSTWGVDFGLLGEDGKILANPVHYRDGRTHNIHEYSDVIMSREAIFAATACDAGCLASGVATGAGFYAAGSCGTVCAIGQPPLVEGQYRIIELFNQGDIVTGNEHADPDIIEQREQRHDLARQLRVEVAGGFIGE